MEKVCFKGLSFIVDSGVYKPSDDSFLLAKHSREAKGKILDIGTGCGIGAIAACAGNKENIALGVDINRKAVGNARGNARKNGVGGRCSFLVSDLFENVNGKFDIILFNPPYLPTENGATDIAWDGGKDGRDVIGRFLEGFDGYLKKDGRMIMVDSSLDNTRETIEELGEMGFFVNIVEKKHVLFETISILEASRKRVW